MNLDCDSGTDGGLGTTDERNPVQKVIDCELGCLNQFAIDEDDHPVIS